MSEIEWVEKGLSPADRLRLIEIAHESKDQRVREHAIRLLDHQILARLPESTGPRIISGLARSHANGLYGA
jgi:hypothetical protein